MDYNASIPFEKKPAIGFYDTSEEDRQNFREKREADQKIIENGIRNNEMESEGRKFGHFEKPKPIDRVKKPNKDAQEEKMRRLAEAEQISKRRKLNLPSPTVSQDELDKVVKLGFAGDRARAMTDTTPDANYSTNLLGKYTQIERATPLRTPISGELEGREDSVTIEVRNQLMRNREQSSLLGQESIPLQPGGTGYTGVTPSHAANGSALAAPQATPFRTPRDTFSINAAAERAGRLASERENKIRLKALRELLAKLPKPKNDYELMEPRFADETDVEATGGVLEEDATDRERRIQERIAEKERLAKARRSQVIQRDLIRPSVTQPEKWKRSLENEDPTANVLMKEMIALISSDAINYPFGNSKVKGTANKVPDLLNEEIERCRLLLKKEIGQLESDDYIQFEKEFLETYSALHNTSSLLPGLVIYEEDDEDVEAAEKFYTNDIQRDLAKKALECNKLENRVYDLVRSSYEQRNFLIKKISHAWKALQTERKNLTCYEFLNNQERLALPNRLEAAEIELSKMQQIEAYAQQDYARVTGQN